MPKLRCSLGTGTVVTVGLVWSASHAACLPTTTPTTGGTVVCSGVTTGSTSVIADPGSTNVDIGVSPGASLSTNATQALLVRDGSSITNNGQITVSGGSGAARAAMGATGNDNTLTNNGTIRTTSGGTAGISTPSGSSTRTLITNTGSIVTTGGASHGIFTFGPGNTVVNSGSITVSGTAAKGVYLQGGNGVANVLINTGTITALGANTSPTSGFADAVHANTVGASTFFSRVENRAGGSIFSAGSYAYRGQNGQDVLVNAGTLEGHGGTDNDGAVFMGPLGTGTLILQTGSVIRGAADGGGATSSAFLEGTGTVDNAFRNFQNLTMRGTQWSWKTDATFSDSIRVESGRFDLSAALTSPVIQVLPGATVAGTGTFVGNVTNNGTLLPGPGAGNGFGAFTVRGNYTGSAGAVMQVNTVLGSDNSPTDRLVIDGGRASGSTGIQVVNRGGVGASTLLDGIQLVQTVNGGTTAAGAFSLTQPIEVGAYGYRLFRGGATGANPDSWYLRTSGYSVGGTVVGSLAEVAATAAPGLASAQQTGTAPDGSPSATPSDPVAAAVAAVAAVTAVAAAAEQPITFFRPEVALYSAVPMVVRSIGLAQLGTFNDRQGDPSLLTRDDGAQASWGRVFGQNTRQRLRGDADPQFDGTVSGLQLGHDFIARTGDDGARDRAGLLAGYTRGSGDVSGMASGYADAGVGRLTVEGYSVGAYWTHIAASGWYSDAVLMGTRFKVDALSTLARGGRPHGSTVSASLEGGYPIALGEQMTLEPQAQLIWQRSSIDDFYDGVSAIRFTRDNAITARLGARLEGRYGTDAAQWRPYLKANLWHTFGGTGDVLLGTTDSVGTRRNASALEVGVGVTGNLSKAVGVYAGLSYLGAVGTTEQKGVQGQLGMRVRW